MAKMFYSLEEAAERLSMSTDEVTGLVSSGKLQEFRDRDRLMFKKDQVDMLAEPDTMGLGGSGSFGGGKDESGMIPLADSGLGSGMSLTLEDSSEGGSGTNRAMGGALGGGALGGGGISLSDENKERSGISIFDTDSTDDGDPMAVTRITETAAGNQELTLDNVGSGSGLLDLTREGDDTSLGADLLQDVYSDQGDGGGASDTQGASGLFESTSAVSDVSGGVAAPAGVMIAAEPYNGLWSGIGGGLALGATIVAAFSLAAVLFGLIGGGSNPIVGLVAGNFWMWIGIFAGIVIFLAIVGALVGKRTA